MNKKFLSLFALPFSRANNNQAELNRISGNMYQAFKSLYSFLCWTNHSSMLCALLCFVEIQTKKEQLQPENTRQLIPEYTRKKEVILCSLENKSSLSISAAAVCLSAVLKNRTLGLQSSRYYPI